MRSLFGAVALAAFALPAHVHAQSAITYQGELRLGGVPANGVYDFRFSLFDAAEFGTLIGPSLCFDDVIVTDGRFTLVLDFGAVYTAPRFLQIQVRDGSGGTCAVILGYTFLSPRQPVSPAPSATHAGTANDAGLLGGQASRFYRNAANLTGTLSDARLSGNVARLDTPATFSGIPNFNGGTSGSTAPFSVDSNFRVSNLNADLLDGLDATAFATASHTHDAAAINAGTLADARLSANIPRLAASNTFTAAQTLSVGATQTPLTLTGSNTQGTWLTITNSAARSWNIISSSTNNAEGAGKLVFRDATAGAVRMTLDTDGDVGIGTFAPAGRLDVTGTDTRFALRNVNDPGGGFVQQTFNSLQLGLYNPGASAWGVVPANGSRALFGVDSTGRVGSLTNTGPSPAFRNLLDNGSGNATIQGNLSARNMPAMKFVRSDTPGYLESDSATLIENISVSIPADGYLKITARCEAELTAYNFQIARATLELKETTSGEVVIRDAVYSISPGDATAIQKWQGVMTIEHNISVSAGVRTFKLRLVFSDDGGISLNRVSYTGSEISVLYIPGSL
jgi:hypothetical protein